MGILYQFIEIDAVPLIMSHGKTRLLGPMTAADKALEADTAYNPEVIKTAKQEKPDIIIVPINGQYGNLNSKEAAMLARDSGAKVAVPCHFWTFVVHRGDPQEFVEQMGKYAPECRIQFLHQGERFIF